MRGIFGAALVIMAAVGWGLERSRAEKERLLILEGLISFVRYAKEQITLFKRPLSGIFESFTNEALERDGFLEILRRDGAYSAACHVRCRLSREDSDTFLQFSRDLGGGYSEGQEALCSLCEKRLSESAEKLKALLPGKLRLYRLIPVLLASSVIILLI